MGEQGKQVGLVAHSATRSLVEISQSHALISTALPRQVRWISCAAAVYERAPLHQCGLLRIEDARFMDDPGLGIFLQAPPNY